MGYPKGKLRRPDVSTETLIELYKQHKKTQVVADLVGMSRAGVWHRLMAVGQNIRQRRSEGGFVHHPEASTKQMVRMYLGGMSSYEIGEYFGMSASAVGHRLHAAKVVMRRHVWTDEENEIIIREYPRHAATGTVGELADRLGRNRYNLIAKAHKMGLSNPANHKSGLRAWHARRRAANTTTRREEHVCIA